MKRLLQIVLISLLPYIVFSQTIEEKKEIIKDYNVEKLDELAKSLRINAQLEKSKAIELAQKNAWFIKKDDGENLYELMGVSEEGNPLYYVTNNKNAAKSTRANTLHNSGLLGLNVEGQNMEAHVWDGGLARTTHQEYDGAGGSNRFSIGDGTTGLHYHSAHVTGTIIASGVSANAKGMAPQADAIGYEWNNDASEATTAANSGMLLSNHSYGWGASSIPDWYFGAYNYRSREWDVIMVNAPYYLMVVSAGNDGNDNSSNGNPLDGNSSYDKLSGFKTSKNNIVVANGQDANIDSNGNLVSVYINSGSSEGPTDDYRIKPDITGNGTSLYSSFEDANNSYGYLTGTSMAAPNVTGTLLLLQQHYNTLNSNYMRAATLKGLALHTADDAGPAGPDVVYGWGLLNAKEAANTISTNGLESSISEIVLPQGGSYSVDIDSDGINNLMASISWTDPAGTANTGTANDNTPVLVNDLDIRVTKGASTYYPYKLTSITTNSTGDNTVDPFEKVNISGASGTYTITVTHKGSLSGGNQHFSLIITGKTGIPAAPVADFTADNVVPFLGSTVTFTDLSSNLPTTWQWSFSGPGNAAFVNGTNTNSTNPEVQFDAIGFYTVTLYVSNTLGNDTEIKTNYIDVTNVSYCIPAYLNGSGDGDYISLVQLGDIDNSTGALPSPFYEFYSDLSTDLETGNAYTITLSAGTYTSLNNISVWIDFNHDGTFSASEKLGNVTLGATPATGTIDFSVPANATTGNTRMRVREVWSNTNMNPCSTYEYGETEDYVINITSGIRLDLTLFLEGPFNGSGMDTDLNSILPLSQPFNTSSWNYNGSESVSSIPTNAVDWVLIELRDATFVGQATGSSIIDRQAGFLRNDGQVINIDENPVLSFTSSISDGLFVVVYQRNHIAIISGSALSTSGGIYTYDFSSGINQAHGGTDGHIQLTSGIWGMFSGDGNADGIVNSSDISPLWKDQSGNKGYLKSDFNLDGESNNIDKDEYWVPNEDKNSQVPN